MSKLDTRGNATLHLTADEFGAFRDRVQALAPASELARVLAEAQPSEHPLTEQVTERQPHPDENLRSEFPDGVEVPVGEVVYAFTITLPPDDVQLAEDALRREKNPIADEVAAFELPSADGSSDPVTQAGLVMP
ncbi:MAG TPA: hypothetical protein VF156_15445 [Agromyces sp.]